MKKLATIAFGFVILLFTQAQETNHVLRIEYESYMKFDVDNMDIGKKSARTAQIQEALKDAMKKPRYYELLTSRNESSWTGIERIDNSQPSNGLKINFSAGSSKNVLLKNHQKNTYVQSMNGFRFSSQDAIIEDSLKTLDWKISREKKKILGYEVRKATATQDSTTITAWYAPKLNFKTGPEKYGHLPGLILALERESKRKRGTSKRSFEAVKIEIPEEQKIKRPKTKGKKVYTDAEFEEISRKQMKKFREMRAGGVEDDD